MSILKNKLQEIQNNLQDTSIKIRIATPMPAGRPEPMDGTNSSSVPMPNSSPVPEVPQNTQQDPNQTITAPVNEAADEAHKMFDYINNFMKESLEKLNRIQQEIHKNVETLPLDQYNFGDIDKTFQKLYSEFNSLQNAYEQGATGNVNHSLIAALKYTTARDMPLPVNVGNIKNQVAQAHNTLVDVKNKAAEVRKWVGDNLVASEQKRILMWEMAYLENVSRQHMQEFKNIYEAKDIWMGSPALRKIDPVRIPEPKPMTKVDTDINNYYSDPQDNVNNWLNNTPAKPKKQKEIQIKDTAAPAPVMKDAPSVLSTPVQDVMSPNVPEPKKTPKNISVPMQLSDTPKPKITTPTPSTVVKPEKDWRTWKIGDKVNAHPRFNMQVEKVFPPGMKGRGPVYQLKDEVGGKTNRFLYDPSKMQGKLTRMEGVPANV